MVCVSHTVLVEAMPQPWLVDVVAVLAGLAEESRAEGGRIVLPDGNAVPGVRLVEGRHLRPGAVYTAVDESGTVRGTVRDWDRRRALRAELAAVSPDGTSRSSAPCGVSTTRVRSR